MVESKYLIIGHLLPQKDSHFEGNLVKELHEKLSQNLFYISINKSVYNEKKAHGRLFNELEFKKVVNCRIPILNDFIRAVHLTFLLLNWCLLNLKNKKRILFFNSPLEVILPIIFFKKIFNLKTFSYTIDTGIANVDAKFSLINKYNLWYFRCGEFLLNHIDGVILLNKNVISYLKLKVPYHLSYIGVTDTQIQRFKDCQKQNKIVTVPYVITYTGSLIYYDGIVELLTAFEMLNEKKYELHIYGKGPLSNIVIEYSNRFTNIKYFGLAPLAEIPRIMSSADLLINPRTTENITDVFGFPSKVIEYLLSGTPVITTRFPALPETMIKYVSLIDDQTPLGIKTGIENFFKNNQVEASKFSLKRIEYIINNYNL